jgi:hypothetical protein
VVVEAMIEFLFVILAVILLIGMLVVIRAVNAMKRVHATAIWLQMQQQLADPKMVQALHTVQSLAMAPSTNGHGPMLMNGQLDAMQTVNRYFANVGTLVRDGVLDEQEVFATMGPTLSGAWHASRSYRDLLSEKHVANHADFDWLYTEWLNDAYQSREQMPTAA